MDVGARAHTYNKATRALLLLFGFSYYKGMARLAVRRA